MVKIKNNFIVCVLLCIFVLLMPLTRTAYAERERYVNKELGISIEGPESWLKELGSPGEGMVYFMQSNNAPFPRVVVMVQTISESKNILEYAQLDIKKQEKKWKKLKTPLTILEPPGQIRLNGIDGSKTIFIMSGYGPKNLKYIDCKFMKGKLVFSVLGISFADDFEKFLKDFEETVESFRFLN